MGRYVPHDARGLVALHSYHPWRKIATGRFVLFVSNGRLYPEIFSQNVFTPPSPSLILQIPYTMLSTEERAQIIALIKEQVVPAIGCTEPICVALAVARATEELGSRPVPVSYTHLTLPTKALG